MKSFDDDVPGGQGASTTSPVDTLSAGGQLIIGTLGPEKFAAKASLLVAALVFAWGLVAYIYQLFNGLAVTDMSDNFSWGVYIINFVFFIGISMAGSLISAILRLTGAGWRHPITRMAEGVTIIALILAGMMIIVDMGRPDRLWHIFVYGRLQSPILWDIFSLTTYLTGSVLFFYLPLIPDLALLRDQGWRFSPWRQKLYRRLSLGWTGSPSQYRLLERCLFIMSIVIIPVAVSIHTVTAWLFGMTLRPGWHSAIIGPDFVVGAVYSGVAAVITVMALARRKFKLYSYITDKHFKYLGTMLLVLCISYIYFVINEHIGSIYVRPKVEFELVESLFSGAYAMQFWSMASIGLFLPALLLILPWTRNVPGIVVASLLVNIGMWIKRYVIVVPTLSLPFLPPEQPAQGVFGYSPTWVEWSITAGAFAAFYLFYSLFAKVFPIISIWETEEDQHEQSTETSGAGSDGTAGQPLAAAKAVIAVAAIIIGSATMSTPALAATGDATNVMPSISLSTEMDETLLLLATLELDGQPLEGYKVAFFAERTFGKLLLGEDTSLDDGTAAVEFPGDLPGDAKGEITVSAKIVSPPEYAGISSSSQMGGAVKTKNISQALPRALWAPRAPIAVIIIVLTTLGVVWGAFGYVVVQLIQLGKEKNISKGANV